MRNLRDTNVSGTILAQYSHSGTSRLALADLQEPDIQLDYFQGTAGTYAGLDRFGRVYSAIVSFVVDSMCARSSSSDHQVGFICRFE